MNFELYPVCPSEFMYHLLQENGLRSQAHFCRDDTHNFLGGGLVVVEKVKMPAILSTFLPPVIGRGFEKS